MNICKKLASFALLAALVGLSLMCNSAPSHAETNDAISYDAATKTLTIQGDCDTGPFDSCASLKYITADEDAHVSFAGNGSAAPTLRYFFYRCSNLTSLDGLSTWDVSNMTGKYCMYSMFYQCTSLTSLDSLSAWDVSHVSGESCMQSLFSGCSSLTSLDGLSSWDVSHVSGECCMSNMFSFCTALVSLDGLSGWDVSHVSGNECMDALFYGCLRLTSLDSLSAWNVSRVTGDECMRNMFYNCMSLASIDALANWDIQNALQSTGGVMYMLGRDYYGPTVSSLTVSSTFTLSDDMFKNFLDAFPTANWWPVDAASPSAVAMDGLVAASQNTVMNGYRWQSCADGSTDNPTQPIASLDVNWPTETTSVYTGYFQNFTPTSVQGDSFTLEAGKDFCVTYQKQGEMEETTLIKDAGTYTATLHIRGKYIYSGAAVTKTVTIVPLDLASDTYDLACYCEPNIYAYTGNLCAPQVTVKLHIGEGRAPSGETYQRYSYLPENISKTPDTEGRDGDYNVAYTNNIYPGTATAKVSPANGNLTNTTQATFTITGDPVPAKVLLIAGGGHFSDGSSTKELSTTAGATLTQSDIETPTREGYTFTGWKDATGTTITFPYTVASESVSFTASWKETPGPDPTPSLTDGWHQDETGWRYAQNGNYLNQGWAWVDDTYGAHWYYFDSNTYMASSRWIWDEGASSWYYICSSGPMIRGIWQWINNEWYGFWWNGKMCRGWVWDNAWQAWFYCYNNGVMARSTWEGPYWLNWEGIWIR